MANSIVVGISQITKNVKKKLGRLYFLASKNIEMYYINHFNNEI